MNLFNFVVLILQLTFFGIFVAFNPMLLLSELLIVLRSKQPLLHSIIFLAGVSLPLIIIAAVGAFVFEEDTSVRAFNSNIQLSPVLDLLIGIILLLIAARLFFVRDIVLKQKSNKRSSPAITERLSYWALFWFAFFRSAISLTSIIGIVAATKVIKEYTDNYAIILLGLLWTITVGMLPFLGMLGYSVRKPETIKTLEQKIDPIMKRDYSGSVKWMILVIGAYFFVRAIYMIKT